MSDPRIDAKPDLEVRAEDLVERDDRDVAIFDAHSKRDPEAIVLVADVQFASSLVVGLNELRRE